MKRINIISILLLLIVQNITAQNLPIIRANSKNVKVRDGLNFKENFWVIFPETNPDVYYVDIPRKEQRITFITDIDSISFDVQYNHHYDFIILLNGKDSCYTRISTSLPKNVTAQRNCSNCQTENDTIPFSMRDNRIYVKTKINGSAELLFQFDLGASGLGMAFVNHRSVKKAKIEFDKKTNLINSDGANETRLSSANEISVGNLKWQNIELVETRNMEGYEDGIIGNGLFLDKYVEVNYDKQILILHAAMPTLDPGFKKYNMLLDNGICPVIEAAFELDGKEYKDWFLFDTGNTGNGIVSNRFLVKNNIYDKFSKVISIGKMAIARITKLHIGDTTFTDGVISLERKKDIAGSYASGGGVIGNKLLKKFNFILDNQQGFIYLKPNFFF